MQGGNREAQGDETPPRGRTSFYFTAPCPPEASGVLTAQTPEGMWTHPALAGKRKRAPVDHRGYGGRQEACPPQSPAVWDTSLLSGKTWVAVVGQGEELLSRCSAPFPLTSSPQRHLGRKAKQVPPIYSARGPLPWNDLPQQAKSVF